MKYLTQEEFYSHDCALSRDKGCSICDQWFDENHKAKSQQDINKKAIKETESMYEGKTIQEIFSTHDPTSIISYMRSIKGLGCSSCGGKVTSRNMYFYDFG